MEDQKSLPAPIREVDYDPKNPYSIISLCGEMFKERYEAHKLERPELFQMDEREYMSQAEMTGVIPTAIENIIRNNLWREYDKVCSSKDVSVFSLKHVYSGYFSDDNFFGKYMESPYRVAWILVPPSTLNDALSEAVTYGVKKMRTLLEIHTKDARIMGMQLNILRTLSMMENQRSGAYKPSGNSVNVQVNLDAATAAGRIDRAVQEAVHSGEKALDSMSVTELEMELEKIKNNAVDAAYTAIPDRNAYRKNIPKQDDEETGVLF